MAFTHTNKITYTYTAGGLNTTSIVSKAETWGAEMNISEEVTTAGGIGEDARDLEYFEFTTKTQARSVMLLMTGDGVNTFDCALWANGTGGTKMADLVDGEPFVWSSSDGSTGNFPPGNENPMVDSTTKLTVKPVDETLESITGTLTVKVLYDPQA